MCIILVVMKWNTGLNILHVHYNCSTFECWKQWNAPEFDPNENTIGIHFFYLSYERQNKIVIFRPDLCEYNVLLLIDRKQCFRLSCFSLSFFKSYTKLQTASSLLTLSMIWSLNYWFIENGIVTPFCFLTLLSYCDLQKVVKIVYFLLTVWWMVPYWTRRGFY